MLCLSCRQSSCEMDQDCCFAAVEIFCNSSSLVCFHLKTKAKTFGGHTDETCTCTFNHCLRIMQCERAFLASLGIEKPVK